MNAPTNASAGVEITAAYDGEDPAARVSIGDRTVHLTRDELEDLITEAEHVQMLLLDVPGLIADDRAAEYYSGLVDDDGWRAP